MLTNSFSQFMDQRMLPNWNACSNFGNQVCQLLHILVALFAIKKPNYYSVSCCTFVPVFSSSRSLTSSPITICSLCPLSGIRKSALFLQPNRFFATFVTLQMLFRRNAVRPLRSRSASSYNLAKDIYLFFKHGCQSMTTFWYKIATTLQFTQKSHARPLALKIKGLVGARKTG